MTHSLQVILLLMLVVAAAKIAGAIATRIHQPSVLGEILAGVLLGPSVLNVLGWPIFSSPNGPIPFTKNGFAACSRRVPTYDASNSNTTAV